jgi:DeoR/GlpR family transcriptional regulator of sugar metabolism
MKMSELFPLFKPGASERTLRNDLHSLVAQGLIKKQGINKNALYEAG